MEFTWWYSPSGSVEEVSAPCRLGTHACRGVDDLRREAGRALGQLGDAKLGEVKGLGLAVLEFPDHGWRAK